MKSFISELLPGPPVGEGETPSEPIKRRRRRVTEWVELPGVYRLVPEEEDGDDDDGSDVAALKKKKE